MSVRKVVTLMPTWFSTAWRMVMMATNTTTCMSVPVKKVVTVPSAAVVPNIGAMAPAKK